MDCDCCKRELVNNAPNGIGHWTEKDTKYPRWNSARRMLGGVYWCSVCVGQMGRPKSSQQTTEKPLFKASESFQMVEALADWLMRLRPLYDRSGWDYDSRNGWRPLPATKRKFKSIGSLTLESGTFSMTLNPLTDGFLVRLDGVYPRDKSPEFLWEHFGKSLARLFRSLQAADAKRLRAIWKNS